MSIIVNRRRLKARIEESLQHNPIVALLGPRQSGKTHLSRQLGVPAQNCFDLEDFSDLTRLQDDPMIALGRLSGLAIVDEVQRMPSLFPLFRVLADRPNLPARFLLLGSASPDIANGASESLAGRVAFIDMAGLSLGEIDPEDYESLWLRGGLPRSFLAPSNKASWKWRLDYIRTFIERDIRDLVETKLSSAQLRRFLLLLADSNGRAWNHSEAGKILGANYKTIQRHLDIFCDALILRELPPMIANVRKRLRKASKYYFRDSGLVHALLSIQEYESLHAHRGYGFSWEGFAIEQIIRILEIRDEDCYSYTVVGGAEMDLVVLHTRGTLGFELKANSAPRVSSSMKQAMADLRLKKVFVVYPGSKDFPLSENIEAIGITNLTSLPDRLP